MKWILTPKNPRFRRGDWGCSGMKQTNFTHQVASSVEANFHFLTEALIRIHELIEYWFKQIRSSTVLPSGKINFQTVFSKMSEANCKPCTSPRSSLDSSSSLSACCFFVAAASCSDSRRESSVTLVPHSFTRMAWPKSAQGSESSGIHADAIRLRVAVDAASQTRCCFVSVFASKSFIPFKTSSGIAAS